MEDFEFGHIDKHSWMWWIACGGGLLGMASAFGLTWLTEMSWPINVGGLPTYAWWPNLIIIFELTMLGAILATVITLVVTAGLGRGGGKLYDPEVTDGSILVGVENPAADRVADLQKALESAPGRAHQDYLEESEETEETVSQEERRQRRRTEVSLATRPRRSRRAEAVRLAAEGGLPRCERPADTNRSVAR